MKPTIKLPVRFTASGEAFHEFTTLELEVNRTVFLLVDCNGAFDEACRNVLEENIAPALNAARAAGIKGVYLYNQPPHPDGPNSVPAELHLKRRGKAVSETHWRSSTPTWTPCIAPQRDEPIISKCAQNGFINSYLDRYLRAHGIETLIVVGFSFKSCLFYTLVGAFEHNYRAVFLRDGTQPPGSNEVPGATDASLPEGGWTRFVLTYLIEDHLGYSSTCRELIKSCSDSVS